MKFANRIWTFQFLWAFGGGLPFFLFPRFIASWTTGTPIEQVPQIEVDQVMLVGGSSMAFCLASALAMTRQTLVWQRGMSVIFIIFLVEWSFILWYDQMQAHYESFVPYLTIVPALMFAALNIWIMLQPGRSEPVPNTRLDPKPIRLRWLWGIQGTYYTIEAIVCLVAAPAVIVWVTAPGIEITEVALEQVRIVSAWTLTLGLLSIYAALENRIRDWRQYRWVFTLSLLARAAAFIYLAVGATYAMWMGWSLALLAVVFAALGFFWTLGQEPKEFRSRNTFEGARVAPDDSPKPKNDPVGVVVLWTVQGFLLTVAGLFFIFAPYTVVDAIVNDFDINPDHFHYAADALRVSGALVIGLAGFTLFALLVSQTPARRRFGILFVLCFAALALALWVAFATSLYDATVIIGCMVLTLLVVFNLPWAVQTPPGARKQNNAGVAGSKPPSSWFGWLLQLAVLVVMAVALIFTAEDTLSFLSNGVSDQVDPDAKKLINHQWQLVGILTAVFAILSGFSMASQRENIWRGMATLTSYTFLVVVLALVFVTFTDRYHLVSLSILAVAVVFFYMNRSIMRHPATWETDDADITDEWTLLDLVAGPLMAMSVLFKKRRSSHLLGAGARGKFVVTGETGSKPEYPEHDFFVPGQTFDVQGRFANLTESDDAALDVRGFSLKFSHHRYESPLDILMNTGTFCPAFNLVTFAGFVASKFVPDWGSRAIVRSNLVAREGGIAGLRRAPDTFADLHYYGQIVRHWVDVDGVRHLVRYRAVPAADWPESGIPSDEDAAHIWERGRLPDETRATNYLRQEILGRVEEYGVGMILQAQFHKPVPGDTLDWYNASVEWDERECPWIELGRVTLTEPLSDADTELLQFNPNNHPYTLGIPAARHPLDFRSMGDSEARVVGALQRVRLWLYSVFGPPSFAGGDGTESSS